MNVEHYERLTPSEAVILQKELRERVRIEPLTGPVKTIAGADISFNRFSPVIYAGIIVLSYPGLEEIEKITITSTAKFPYIPGLLAFREMPAITEAWNRLGNKPDLMVFDGHGIAHPRRVGIATNFGIMAGIPTVGCAKTKLTGSYEEPANEPFATSSLVDKGEVIGTMLRTKKNCKPIFVSPGHLIDFAQSVEILEKCVTKYRVPEPTRLAHLLVNEARRQDMQNKAR